MEEEEILLKLGEMRQWNSFAMSLLVQYTSKGNLSERQWDAAENMINKVQRRTERREEMTRDVDVSRIKTLLETAKVKKPVFRAAELAFSLAPMQGRNGGAVYVKRGPDYQGKIMQGKFMPVSTCHTATADAVVRVASDPRGEAVQHLSLIHI